MNVVVNLCVPFDTIIDRVKDRWIHPASGKVYNLVFNPPKVEGKDDETGEPLVQRDDDKPESVRNRYRKLVFSFQNSSSSQERLLNICRLEVFQNVTEPVLDFYRKMGICQV